MHRMALALLVALAALTGNVTGTPGWMAGIAAVSETGPSVSPIGAQATQPPTGQWRVTRLTGTITQKGYGPEPPAGICHNDEQTSVAVLGDSSVELVLLDGLEGWENPAAVEKVVGVFEDLPNAINEELVGPPIDSARLFLFHFEFDNGYHDNEILLSMGEEGSVILTGSVLAPGMYAIGSWVPSDGYVYGLFGVTNQMFGSGMSLFRVVGSFDGPRRLSGEWSYLEESTLLDCTSASIGNGQWEAVARGR